MIRCPLSHDLAALEARQGREGQVTGLQQGSGCHVRVAEVSSVGQVELELHRKHVAVGLCGGLCSSLPEESVRPSFPETILSALGPKR